MEAFSALLALCAGNSSVTGEFPSQRPVARSFDVLFDLRLNKRLSKTPVRRRWFQTPSHSLWRHCNVNVVFVSISFSPSYLAQLNQTPSPLLNVGKSLGRPLGKSPSQTKHWDEKRPRLKWQVSWIWCKSWTSICNIVLGLSWSVTAWKNFPHNWPFVLGMHHLIPLMDADLITVTS